MAHPVLDFVVTPAFVSGLVTWILSQRWDGIKARRDFNTRVAEQARDSIKDAAKAAAEYFSTPVGDRTLIQEAMLIVSDRDVQISIERVRAAAPATEGSSCEQAVQDSLLNFQALLTGGSFQQRDPAQVDSSRDADQIRRLAAEAAALRAAVTELRDSQLRRGTFGHAIGYRAKPVRNWLLDQRGVGKS